MRPFLSHATTTSALQWRPAVSIEDQLLGNASQKFHQIWKIVLTLIAVITLTNRSPQQYTGYEYALHILFFLPSRPNSGRFLLWSTDFECQYQKGRNHWVELQIPHIKVERSRENTILQPCLFKKENNNYSSANKLIITLIMCCNIHF